MASLVGGAKTGNWLAQNLHVVRLESQGYLSLHRPSLRSKRFQPHTKLPSQEQQCWEEEPPKHLAVKMSGDSIHPGEKENCWEAKSPLKRACT